MGDYTKALQYAETAVKDEPTDPSLRGNWGVMFYRNFQYQQAMEQLDLAVNGGKTQEGFPIHGLPLKNEGHIPEYYFTYGLALARMNQCGKALQIAQAIQTSLRLDDDSMQAVREGADSTIQICQENLDNPILATSTPAATEETAVPATEAPLATETP
jgi:Tfp pilus assembly protein PilF